MTASEPLTVDEPLRESAVMMERAAGVMCDDTECGWYHGSWQYLRLLDMVATPSWHRAFYLQQLTGSLGGGERSRVLISGTTDYSMLAFVDAAARAVAADPEIVVLDRCATPLFACRWLADRISRPVRTVQADARSLAWIRSPSSTDLICADAFLTRFSRREARAVVEAWASVLRPGGELITTVRVDGPGGVDADVDRVGSFVRRARAGAISANGHSSAPSERIAALAECYATRMRSGDLGDPDQVMRMMRDARLDPIHTELAELAGEHEPTVYLRIRARRTG